jgi:hypothetical protein
MEKTLENKVKEGLFITFDYLKKNFLSLVVFLLTILIFAFLALPAASVTVSDIGVVTPQETYTLIAFVPGGNVQAYLLSDILFGRIIQGVSATFNYINNATPELSNPNLAHTIPVVFFPNNVFVGGGLLLFIVAAVLMFFPKVVVRTVGASLALVGATLMFFIFSQVMYDIPVSVRGATVAYDVTYSAGPIVLIITGFAIAGVATYITVMDYLANYQHRKSEIERYLRGGI